MLLRHCIIYHAMRSEPILSLVYNLQSIMAWACRRSIVTMEYIEALLKRRDAQEEFPKEEDY